MNWSCYGLDHPTWCAHGQQKRWWGILGWQEGPHISLFLCLQLSDYICTPISSQPTQTESQGLQYLLSLCFPLYSCAFVFIWSPTTFCLLVLPSCLLFHWSPVSSNNYVICIGGCGRCCWNLAHIHWHLLFLPQAPVAMPGAFLVEEMQRNACSEEDAPTTEGGCPTFLTFMMKAPL